MTKQSEKIFLLAGEKSGDTHGSHLVQALQKKITNASYFGIPGPEMRKAGVQALFPMEDLTLIGFTDIFLALPKIVYRFYQIKHWILKENPSRVILIDYPGFNLRLAKSLKKSGYQGKIIQYISPSVWAWGKNRVQMMAQNLDLLLCIYPFEPEIFSGTALPSVYVGSPVKEAIDHHHYHPDWKKEVRMPQELSCVALFPGSRKKEILYNLPLQLKTCDYLKHKNNQMIFGLSVASEEIETSIKQLITKSTLKLNQDLFLIPSHFRYELMKDSVCALSKAGTVSLELGLHQCPSVIMYQISKANRWIIDKVLKVHLPHYCIANIICKKAIFPEFIREIPTPEKLGEELLKFYYPGPFQDACKKDCNQLAFLLNKQNVNEKASLAILSHTPS